MTIDPDTREPIENVYIREVAKENGRLYNKTIHTYHAQKEPWHELQRKGKSAPHLRPVQHPLGSPCALARPVRII